MLILRCHFEIFEPKQISTALDDFNILYFQQYILHNCIMYKLKANCLPLFNYFYKFVSYFIWL